ncbi:DUF3410 domain-containing protein, partial [Candidatus Sumerlaeota bacterium]|nr:DUF3410 domain-containing protein [Candidatus Sumerlaeota bacterium]
DFVTLHVPLTRGGPDATKGLIDSSFIQAMARGSALINAARGGVVDEPALLTSIGDGRLGAAALDAWVGEPDISIDAIQRVDVATPHVAGYSAEGKLRGTEMIYRAFCRFANLTPVWSAASELPEIAATVERKGRIADTEQSIADLIEAASPLRRDDSDLRKISALPREERGPYFDSLRKNYRVRREFSATRVIVDDAGSDFAETARALGFTVSRDGFQEL